MGNRIAKHVYNNGTGLLEKSTYYILDAQGQQLSMYEHNVGTETVSYYLTERNIFGSSRLGITRDTVNMYSPELLPSYGVLGNRNYELSNHLGNVLAVINDVKIPLDENSDTYVDGYQTGIVNVSDYSPFGVQLNGRTFDSEEYRRGFNGMEKDDEVSGEGNSYTAEFWQYSPRIGRRWNIDPVDKPWISSYHAFSNKPIMNIDPNGANDDNYLTKSNGEIEVEKTNDATDNFKYQDKNGNVTDLGTYAKNKAGLINFPTNGTGFTRYGTSDAGGTSTTSTEVVGQGDHYIEPITAAALFGLTSTLKSEYAISISLGDMSSSNGSDPWQPGFFHHAGHGHFGVRSGLDVDFRYVGIDGLGIQSPNAFKDDNFSTKNNQIVFDMSTTFGFTKNYQGYSGNLVGPTNIAQHNDHGHLGIVIKNVNIKVVETLSINQIQKVVNVKKAIAPIPVTKTNNTSTSEQPGYFEQLRNEFIRGLKGIYGM